MKQQLQKTKTMKTLKKHILKINPKYMAYGTANWYKQSDYLSKYYCFTEATVTQLRKLNIPTIKATYGLNNAYGSHYFPMTGNLIRKKDTEKVQEYFNGRNLKRNDAGFEFIAGIY